MYVNVCLPKISREQSKFPGNELPVFPTFSRCGQKQNKLQKRAAEETELNEERKKLKKLEHTLVSLTTDADKHAMEAEKKNNFTLLAKSNALRQKAKQMEGDIKKQKDVVSKLSASLQKV